MGRGDVSVDDHQERLKNKKCVPLFFPDPACEKHLREALKKHFTLKKKKKKIWQGGKKKEKAQWWQKAKPNHIKKILLT